MDIAVNIAAAITVRSTEACTVAALSEAELYKRIVASPATVGY